MRRLAAALVLVCGCASAARADIRTYDLRLRVGADGNADATLTLELTAADAATRVPVGPGQVTGLIVTAGPEGTQVASAAAGRQSVLTVTLPSGTPAPVALTIRFRVSGVLPEPVLKEGERATLPAGVRVFKYAFVNTEPAPIGHYVVEAVLPEGWRAHAVREALPKLRAGEAGPRVRLGGVDVAHGARLEVAGLAQGDSASMQVEVTRQERTWTWLVAGVLLALAYLYSFRDLVSRPAAPGPVVD
jgi:hypothetical protein